MTLASLIWQIESRIRRIKCQRCVFRDETGECKVLRRYVSKWSKCCMWRKKK